MTISIVNKLSTEETTLSNSFGTSPITTITGRLYLLCISVLHYPEYVGSTVASISSAGGVTWAQAASAALNGAYPIEIWYGYCSSGSTGISWTVTLNTTPSIYSSRVYIIDEATATATSGIVVQADGFEDNTSPVTATLSAFTQASNAAYEFCVLAGTGDQTITVESGHTQLGSAPMSIFNMLCKTGYFAGADTSPSYTFTGTSPTGDILAIEIQSDGSGGMQPNSLMLMGCGI